MAKKVDAKAAALAAAQGSGAVFDALQDETHPAAPEPGQDEIKTEARAEEAVAPTQNEQKDEPMNAQTFAPAMDEAAEKVRTMFTGANPAGFDGKEVLERTQRLAQDAAELAKANLEAMAASARIAAQNAGTLTQDVAAVGRKSFESASEAVKGFAEAKSPTELLRLQGEFARSYMETMIAEGTRMSETIVKLTGEAMQPVQNQMAANAAKVKSIAG